MNRSIKSVNDISLNQSQVLKNSKKSHEKAFHFRVACKNIVNLERSKSL